MFVENLSKLCESRSVFFSHVRGHRKGSIDPTRLKIRIVANGRRVSNQIMRRHVESLREKLEKYATNVREARATDTVSKTTIEGHEASLKDARARLKEIEEAARSEEMDTSETIVGQAPPPPPLLRTSDLAASTSASAAPAEETRASSERDLRRSEKESEGGKSDAAKKVRILKAHNL